MALSCMPGCCSCVKALSTLPHLPHSPCLKVVGPPGQPDPAGHRRRLCGAHQGAAHCAGALGSLRSWLASSAAEG